MNYLLGLDSKNYNEKIILDYVIDDFKMFTYARDDASFIMNNLDKVEFERFVLYVKNMMKNEVYMCRYFVYMHVQPWIMHI